MSIDHPIVVKFVQRGQRQIGVEHHFRQFPGGQPVWGRCRFLFDPDARGYDWLVVCDDLPRTTDGRAESIEQLASARQHTILGTTEPSSIKHYSRRYAAQFEFVRTSQETWALRHPRIVPAPPMLHWFYGVGRSRLRPYDEVRNHPPLNKSRIISTVCSAKQQRHTLHQRRYNFTQELQGLLPELDVFGRGVRDMNDKAEALDDYRYHVAVENHKYPHHWTEKLLDPFLGCCLPFYYGAPNAADYFPEGSFIPIDIYDSAGAARTIHRAIDAGEYEKRLPLIMEARRRVMEEHNVYGMLSRFIEQHHTDAVAAPGVTILSRHAVRSASPINCLEELWEKFRRRIRRPRNTW